MQKTNLILPALAILSGCGANDTNSNIPDTSTQQVAAQEMNAMDVTKKLADAGLPVADVVEVTEANDDNKQLGRPGQYISKAYFIDERYRGQGLEPAEQNTIETFASEEDATRRREYVQSVVEQMPMFNQYIIQSGKVVVRLDKSLSPADAKEYEDAL